MDPVVEVESGRLQGAVGKGGRTGRAIHAFLGIPYAADPVGDRRFRAPQPVEPWAGTRLATVAGPSSVQSTTGLYSGMIPGNRVATTGEACLTLDMWVPERDSGPLPVLVWVPGGAFLTGGTSLDTYDGSGLAADGNVIVVGVNYRLGVLGYGWFGDADLGDTNCGLRDQVAALGWVRRNIAAFGGDPANVTAFGESAGAGSLAHLLASPAGAGLVRRCVLQSPGIDHTLYPEDVERVADAVLQRLEVPRSRLRSLLDVDVEHLLDAQEAAVVELLPTLTSMSFHPFVDGDLLPDSPSAAFTAGAAADVDLLVSWTSDEMRLFPNPAADALDLDGLATWAQAYLTGRMGTDPGLDRARDLVAWYRDRLAAEGRTRGADLWAALQTDGAMRLPARRVADSHAGNGGRTFVAEFSWRGAAPPGEWDPGAFHAIDLPFTFDTLDRAGWREFLHAGPDADVLASQHLHAWASFGTDGTPVLPDGPAWPRYDLGDRATALLDAPCSVVDDPLAEVAGAWDGLWSSACRAPAAGFG